MRTIRLVLQYEGTEFSGWQVQSGDLRTVENVLGGAVVAALGQRVKIRAAGRTDAGVHALGQVASFETDSVLPVESMRRALNANLPHDVRVESLTEAEEGFHPRYDARGKRYRYLILNRREKAVFVDRYAWHLPVPLDVGRMARGAEAFVGKHDFSSLRGSGCTARHPVREIRGVAVERVEEIPFLGFRLEGPLVSIAVEGDAFLRHMVRNLVGTLVDMGRGRTPVETAGEILAARDRSRAGPTAPARGLFLERVNYE